jgi:hypothetical protein
MPLHIVKLCVGAQSIEDLADWHKHQTYTRQSLGLDPRPVCDTRMTPKRAPEVLDGGSLYWVIKGVILVRQAIVDIATLEGEGGRSRCELVLDPTLVRTAPMKKKAFQGWRYFDPKDAPADLAQSLGGDSLPDALKRALIDIGAW